MKKYVLCLGLIFGLNPPAYAQMAETIGTLGIYGTMQREGMQNIAKQLCATMRYAVCFFNFRENFFRNVIGRIAGFRRLHFIIIPTIIEQFLQ